MRLQRQVFILALLSMVTSAGCSFDSPKKNSKSSLRIILEEKTRSLANSKDFLFGGLTTLVAPSSTSDINCFAVNITGPGIIPATQMPGGCTMNDNFHGKGPGILTKPTARGGSIEIDLPPGPARSVDVYGIYPGAPECGGTGGPGVTMTGYFLGSRTVDVMESGAVTVPVSYTSGQPASLSCTPPVEGGGGGSTPYPELGNGADGAPSIAASIADATTNGALLGRTLAAARMVSGVSADAKTLTTNSAFTTSEYNAGDEVVWMVMGASSPTSCSTASDLTVGTWGRSRVTSVNTGASQIVLTAPVIATGTTVVGANLTAAATGTFCRLQVVRVPNFTSLNIIAAITLAVPMFDYTTGIGGLLPIAVNGTVTFGGAAVISAAGYQGGSASTQGAGTTGSGGVSTSANGTGGGGSSTNGGGGGGGLGAIGGSGGSAMASGGATGGCAGNCVLMGGAGGGGNVGGGNGGGIVMLWARTTSGAGTIDVTGANGTGGTYGGGGGAGGSVYLMLQTGVSTLTVSATGGSGGTGTLGGGGGGGGALKGLHCTGSPPSIIGVTGGSPGASASSGGNGFSGFNPNPSSPFCSL